MAGLWILVLGLAAGATAATNRIIGGTPTVISQHPWLVQVENQNFITSLWSQNCAGSVLNQRHILSAAHCFEGSSYSPRFRRIRAGATVRHSSGQIAYVEREINHPTYGQLGFDGDLTVVRLLTPLFLNSNTQPGTITGQGSMFRHGFQVLKAGWGAVTNYGWPSGQLREVVVYTIDNQLCRDRYRSVPPGHIVTPNMLCSGILDVGGKDACFGDSGGPVYFNMIIVGVISFGHCGNATLPGVSTNVGSYTNWIVSTVAGQQ